MFLFLFIYLFFGGGGWYIFFQDSLMNRKVKIIALLEIEIYWNIINIFTVTFEQYAFSLY